MRYVQTNSNGFMRHIHNDFEVIRWDSDNNCSIRKLADSQKTVFGVSKLKLVTPPAFNPASQTRTEGDAVLIDGVWTQNWTVTSLSIDARQTLLLEKAKKQKNAAFYSNVTIPFPADDKEIHFRNETDRANIGDKILKAFMQVTAGNGASSIKFTPVDKVEVTMTCLQLLTAFTALAEGKDQLFYAYNDVIADIRAATNTDELDAAEIALNDL